MDDQRSSIKFTPKLFLYLIFQMTLAQAPFLGLSFIVLKYMNCRFELLGKSLTPELLASLVLRTPVLVFPLLLSSDFFLSLGTHLSIHCWNRTLTVLKYNETSGKQGQQAGMDLHASRRLRIQDCGCVNPSANASTNFASAWVHENRHLMKICYWTSPSLHAPGPNQASWWYGWPRDCKDRTHRGKNA